MKFIDIKRLLVLSDELHKEFQSKSPYRYLVFDNILNKDDFSVEFETNNSIYTLYLPIE